MPLDKSRLKGAPDFSHFPAMGSDGGAQYVLSCADGYLVMEVIADPEDIMGAPGSGPVLRRHFERILGTIGNVSLPQ